jgi:hypothetical protein
MVVDMNKVDDMAIKRLLLAAVRTRFSPQIQKLKEDAMDGIVERILITAEKGKHYSAKVVQNIFSETAGFYIVFNDIYSSLQRLLDEGKVEKSPEEVSTAKLKVKGKQKELFKINDGAREEIEEYERVSFRRFNSVVSSLFKDSDRDSALYDEPFLRFLSVVFFRLASESVRSLLGEASENDVVSYPIFKSAMESISRDLQSLNREVFENGVINFFRNNNPEYAAIKWNLAQSYHSLRAIGLHEGGSILGGELFKNAEFYIDTNVVISALMPEEEYHTGFIALCKACNKLGKKIRVCQITLEELDRTVDAHIDMLVKVVNQIPEETAVKVYSGFFEIYHKKMQSGEEIDFSEIFANFYKAREVLEGQFNVQIEDNEWFIEERSTEKTTNFAEIIKKRFADMSRRNKNDNACIHDSLCLQWIDEYRTSSGNKNIWFITRDHTLPGCVPEGCGEKSLSMHLDAILQWLAPIAVGETDEVDLELAYSQMLVSRVLPQERIFNLEDFLIFDELNMTCKELPSEDVEGCIQTIKKIAPLLNPTIPSDRERLAHEVSSYFADPSRKYTQNIVDYEAKLSKVLGDLAGVRNDLDKEKKVSSKREAWLRVSVVGIVFTVLESITIIIASILGTGVNAFQRIASSWPIIVVIATACIIFGGFFVGKKRIKELGWPVTKIFK